MDRELLIMFLKIIVILPFVLCLIYIFLKYGGTRLQNMQNGRFIKILERVSISKENSIMVVKIGNKTCVVTSTNNKIEILRELDKDEEIKLEESRTVPQYASLKDMYMKIKGKGRE